MTELRRWSEEGATAEERTMLEASRRQRVPAHALARTLRALGVATAATTLGTTTVAAAATQGGLAVASKVLILALVGSGVVAGGLAVRAAHHPQAPRTTTSVAAPVPRPVSANPAPIESPSPDPSAAPAVVAEPPAPAVAPARPARSSSSSSSDRLPREVNALELAHRALVEHDPNRALGLLDRYRAQFPAGSLSSEALVLRAQALLASGDRAGAQAIADTYSAAHPESPYARRLQEMVHGR